MVRGMVATGSLKTPVQRINFDVRSGGANKDLYHFASRFQTPLFRALIRSFGDLYRLYHFFRSSAPCVCARVRVHVANTFESGTSGTKWDIY